MAEDRNGFWLLAAGTLLFAAAFLLGYQWLHIGYSEGSNPPLLLGLCTIAFGLPYLARELLMRRTNWWLVGLLLIVVPLFHGLAAYVFTYVSTQVADAAAQAAEAAATASDPSAMMAPAAEGSTTPQMFIGLAAGAAGAIGPLLLIGLLPRLRAPGFSHWLCIGGLVALAWWGAMGVRLVSVESAYDLVVTLFLPWQVLFAFLLAHLLKASPRKDAAAT